MDYQIKVRAADKESADTAVSEALKALSVNEMGAIDWDPVTLVAATMIDILDDKELDVVVEISGTTNFSADQAHQAKVSVNAFLIDRQ